MSTADKLQYLIDSKNSISAAIEAKGGTVPQELSGYGPAIEALPSGGGGGTSDLAKKIIDKSVTEITSADLSGATKIGQYALYSCYDLESISIPDSVDRIEQYGFRYCRSLSSISFGNSLTAIGNYGFGNCTSLTSISIPDSVVSTGTNGFNTCTSLVSATIGNGVSSIGNQTFYGCSNLSNVYFKDDRQKVPTLNSSNVFGNLPTDYLIWVPSALYDAWTTSGNWSNSAVQPHIIKIGSDPYTYVSYLDDTVSAFLILNYLKKDSIPDINNAVEVKIGSAVRNISGDNTAPGKGTFAGCSNLTSVTIPDSVRNIEGLVFYACSNLTSITIPGSVSSFGDSIFSNAGISSVDLEYGVTSIGTGMFSTCRNLTSISIPDSVTSIGVTAFYSCNGLTSIIVGSGVTSIGFNAFYSCSNCIIFDFSRAMSVPTLTNTGAFTGTPGDKKIIVPDSLYETWKTTANWNSSTNGIVDAITKASEA